jgi:GGDEF domain-containing protein
VASRSKTTRIAPTELPLISDVTHNKHTEKQLVYEALHDKLTGLPNRALFIDRLNQTIKRLRRPRT